jgi:hypothetical protein
LRKNQLAYTVADTRLEQVTRSAGIVAVVFQRLAHRFRYDRIGGEVHHGVDLVLAQYARDQFRIADVTDDQRYRTHRLAKAGVEIIDRNDMLIARLQLQQHMAADIASGAGDQDRFLGHGASTSLRTDRVNAEMIAAISGRRDRI